MDAKTNVVGWFEIYVDDMARARGFYEAVFGESLQSLQSPGADFEMYAFAQGHQGYGATGALVRDPRVRPGQGGTMVYFACKDCAHEAGLAEANGGRVFQAKRSIAPHGFIAIVGDSEGNVIGLHSMA